MKSLLLALHLVLTVSAYSQEQVNSLIRAGKYEDALRTIKATDGENSKRFRELKQWMIHGYRANLIESDTDIHISPESRPGESLIKSEPQGYRITLASGFPNSWFVVMSKNAHNTEAESYKGPGPWPTEWIREKWNEGYRISQVAGEKDGWVVVMSKGTGYTQQQYFGPGSFPEKGMGDSSIEGYRITGIAGLQNEWVAIVSKGSRLGRQRFTFPTDFSSKKEWIKQRWDEGYRITHLAGDSSSDGENYIVIVMSENSGLREQTYRGPESFPGDWIRQKWRENYKITSATGFEKWILVMSKGASPGTQSYKRSESFPSEFIKSKW